MIRAFAYEALLFALPFLLYGVYLLARGRRGSGFSDAAEKAPLLMLVFLGVISMGIGLAFFAHFGGLPDEVPYIPAHMEDGRLVSPPTR